MRWFAWLLLLSACREQVEVESAQGRGGRNGYQRALRQICGDAGEPSLQRGARPLLDGYLDAMSSDWPGNMGVLPTEWINVHNAIMLRERLLAQEEGRPWTDDEVRRVERRRAYRIDGHYVSASEIRHERIRGKHMHFPHLALLWTGASDSPPFPCEKAGGGRLSQQADEALAAWLADEARGIRVQDGEVLFPPAFERYRHDIELQAVGESWCVYAGRKVDPPLRAVLREAETRGCPHRVHDGVEPGEP